MGAHEQVSELYETFPYPAHGIISSVLPQLAQREVEGVLKRASAPRYVDAGCGTGEQALGMKRAFPKLDVTGIDFSEAALVFARDLAARNALSASFERRNLMEPLEGLGPFDLLSSIGVLHHLAEPALALRNLRATAAKGATLLGMVYSTYGKWDLFRTRDALNLIAGPNASRDERLALVPHIRSQANAGPAHYLATLKQRRRFGPSIAPTEAVKRVVQGRSAAYQADAFTHPHELTFTCQELAELLATTGWEWDGWPERSGMPDRASQVLTGKALARAEQMSRLEQASIFEKLVCPQNLFFIGRAV